MSDFTINVTSNAVAYRKAFEKALPLLHQSVAESVWQEAVLRFKHAVRLTPPKTQAQGRKRVAVDILKAIQPLDPDVIEDEQLAQAIRAKDFDYMNARLPHVFTRNKQMRVMPTTDFNSLHYPQRNKRGRVVSKKPKFATPYPGKLNAYIRKVQKRVGMAKGGWASTLAGLTTRNTPGYVRRLRAAGGNLKKLAGRDTTPKYAKRHSRWGTFDGTHLKMREGRGGFVSMNNSPWADENNEANRAVMNAMKSRTVALERKVAHLLKKNFEFIAQRAPKPI